MVPNFNFANLGALRNMGGFGSNPPQRILPPMQSPVQPYPVGPIPTFGGNPPGRILPQFPTDPNINPGGNPPHRILPPMPTDPTQGFVPQFGQPMGAPAMNGGDLRNLMALRAMMMQRQAY